MSNISVTVKEFDYPSFVNDIFDKIDNETKNLIVKNVIMSHVEKKYDEFEISELAQSLTNRIPILPDIESIEIMLRLFAYLYPYWLTEKL